MTAPPGPIAIAIDMVRDFIWSNIPIIHPILKVLSIWPPSAINKIVKNSASNIELSIARYIGGY